LTLSLRVVAPTSDTNMLRSLSFEGIADEQTAPSDRITIRFPFQSLENVMNIKRAVRSAAAVSVALVMSTAYAADDSAMSANPNTATNTTSTAPAMTGKQKATAIGATTGAVAGAVVGGPVGAVVGAGIGGVVGHEGMDANGKVSTTSSDRTGKMSSMATDSSTVRNAQSALNDQGYNPGAVDGQWGPSTQSAVRRFQSEHGLSQSGKLDSATLQALGLKS